MLIMQAARAMRKGAIAFRAGMYYRIQGKSGCLEKSESVVGPFHKCKKIYADTLDNQWRVVAKTVEDSGISINRNEHRHKTQRRRCREKT